MYSVREDSNFVILHVTVQFSQFHLLKRVSFLHCILLPPLSYTVGVWVYLWAFYLVLSCSVDLYFCFCASIILF